MDFIDRDDELGRLNVFSEQWEALVRRSLPRFSEGPLAAYGPWTRDGRFWRGGGPEWDIVALSEDRKRVLLGEAK